MKELLIMAKSLGGGGSEVALIELINALPEEVYNITLVLLDSDNEYAYRLKKKVNIVQLTFNSSFAKSLVSMYAFPAKVLKKLSVNSFIPYYDFISNCVTNVFEKTYDVAIDFYGYGSFVTAFLATKIQAKKKATWLHDERLYWLKSVQKYLCKYDKVYGVSQAVVDAFCREYPHYKDKAAVFYNVIDAGMQDPHVDVAMFCIYSLYNKRQVDRLIAAYFTEGCSDETRIKIYCYIAACGLLWSNWCEYKRNLGVEFGEYSLRQYRYAKDYYRIVQEELKKQGEKK